MSKADGGPAFPTKAQYWTHVTGDVGGFNLTGGMSLHQWYAGIALQALVSLPDFVGTPREIASEAFSYADAMITEGAKDD